MAIVFTRHARNRLRRTKLDEATLINMLSTYSTEIRTGNRVNRWLQWNDGWIRVVLVEEAEGDAIVITVIWPARAPRTKP